MKKIIMALVAVFALTLSAYAQDEPKEAPQMPNKEEMAQRMTDMMAENLGLTEEQKESVLAINKEYADKIQPRMHRPGGPQEGVEKKDAPEGKVEEDASRAEYEEALKAVLNEEQLSKYEEMQKNMRHGGGPRPGGPRGKGPGMEGEGPQGPAPIVDVPDDECTCGCPEGCDCKANCAEECQCKKECTPEKECNKEGEEECKKECPAAGETPAEEVQE